MKKIFVFTIHFMLVVISYAQYTLPSSYRPRSEFPDNESFLHYNFEKHKGDYCGKELGLLYMAYGTGIDIKEVTTLATTPWMEDDNRPYVEGVSIEYTSLDEVLRGEEYVSVYAYIVRDNKGIPDDAFWHEMPDTGIIEALLDRTRRWVIRDIEVLKFQLLSVPK